MVPRRISPPPRSAHDYIGRVGGNGRLGITYIRIKLFICPVLGQCERHYWSCKEVKQWHEKMMPFTHPTSSG